MWRRADVARKVGGVTPSGEREGRTRARLENHDTFLKVAVFEGRVIGFSAGAQAIDIEGDGSVIPGLCNVAAVFVEPERWGRGVGKVLVDAVLARARERGYERAQLWTHVNNDRARRLYEGKGFVASGRRRNRGEDEILHYERPL